jgi:hypothetical protein
MGKEEFMNKFEFLFLSSWQVEVPDDWLRYPMPWEVIRLFPSIEFNKFN